MKKIFLTLVIFTIISLPSVAEDSNGYDGVESLMNETSAVENAFVGQKKISDEDFQKTLKEVQGKQKKGKKVQAFKGKHLNDENSGDYIDETADKSLLLSIPLELVNGDGADIPIGHYKIVGAKEGDKVYLDLYQSSTVVAKVPAIETNNDFGEMAINFVKLLPYDEKRIKIIYGSMDFNAYTFINIKHKISDEN